MRHSSLLKNYDIIKGSRFNAAEKVVRVIFLNFKFKKRAPLYLKFLKRKVVDSLQGFFKFFKF